MVRERYVQPAEAAPPRPWFAKQGTVGRRERVARRWHATGSDTGLVPVRVHHIVIDAVDLGALANFWSAALGWPILSTKKREGIVGPSVGAPIGLCFMPAGARSKTTKNRLHLDLTTSAEDRSAEIARLLALGAHEVDVGQTGRESWVVLADPEGNEFCIVRPKTTLVT